MGPAVAVIPKCALARQLITSQSVTRHSWLTSKSTFLGSWLQYFILKSIVLIRHD